MRKITKNTTSHHPLDVCQLNTGVPKTKEEATRFWKRFSDTRGYLCERLLKEQYGLCCYTEMNISDFSYKSELGFHFEHELPKSLYPNKTFDVSNILCCILSSADLLNFRKDHSFGGHHKQGIFNNSLFISPQSNDCRDYFIYLHNGLVEPAHSQSEDNIKYSKAKYTIDLLNLNAPFLVSERERWINEISEEINKLIDSDDIIAIENMAECELTLTKRSCKVISRKPSFDQLNSFHSATRSLFGKIGEEVISSYCHYI